MNELRRDQMVLALSTLVGNHEPTVSRCVTVLPCALWIAWSCGLTVSVQGVDPGSGPCPCHLTVMVGSTKARDVVLPNELYADSASEWVWVARQVVVTMWALMRPDNGSEDAKCLAKKVGDLLDKISYKKGDER